MNTRLTVALSDSSCVARFFFEYAQSQATPILDRQLQKHTCERDPTE